MKVLILDGSIEKTSFSERALEVLHEVFDRLAIASEIITLREKKISYCRGCFGCWVKTPGVCVIHDDALDISRRMIQSDLVVYLTPILFGGYSHLLKAQLDRSIGLVLPYFGKFHGEVHHKKRYDTYASILGIGLQEETNQVQADLFAEHISRNSRNLHCPQADSVVLHSGLQYQDMLKVIGDAIESMEVSS
jgi:multimeric flavodoxin WrbA